MRRIDAIVVHHTASYPGTTVAEIRRWHLAVGYSDIAYHYVITDTGEVIRGRPLHRVGAHARGHNAHTVGVALVGNFDLTSPTDLQLEALKTLLQYLRARFTGVNVYGHQEVGKTRCPGKHLMEWLREWRAREGVVGSEGTE